MVSVWLYLLTHARHEAGSWKGLELDAGQLVIGRKALSEKTGVSERACRTAIERLKSTNAITTKTTNKYTLVTIVNWAFYQQDGEKTTSKPTSKTTNKRPANDQQTTTNKNVKNEKNERSSTPKPPIGGAGTGAAALEYASMYLSGISHYSGEVVAWAEKLSPEIVMHAVDEACANDKCFWKYADGILKRYEKEGVKSVQEAKASDGKMYASTSTFGLNPWLYE